MQLLIKSSYFSIKFINSCLKQASSVISSEQIRFQRSRFINSLSQVIDIVITNSGTWPHKKDRILIWESGLLEKS